MKHSEKFIEKHLKLIENRIKQNLEKYEKKMLRHLEISRVKKKQKKERYKDAKENNTTAYQKYLQLQKTKYREKYKNQREAKYKEKIAKAIDNEKFGVYINKKGYECYITESGRIINRFGKTPSGSKTKNGYTQYEGEGLHRIVWKTFNGEIPANMEIDHIVPIKNGGGNEISNLRLVSHKDNCNNPLSIINYQKHNKKVDRSYLKKLSM